MARPYSSDRNAEINKIVEYIKEKSINGEAVNLTIKEASGLFGFKTTKTFELLKKVRELDNIEAVQNENSGGSGRTKSFFYKYVENTEVKPRPNKLVKYKFLTDEELSKVETALGVNNATLEMSLKMLNILSLKGAKEDYISYVDELATLLVLTHSQVRLYINMLKRLGLLTVNSEEKIKLTISVEEKQKVVQGAVQEEFVIEKAPANVISEVIKAKELAEEINSEIDQDSAIAQTLISNLKDFTGFVGDFKQFIENISGQIEGKYSSNPDEINKLREELALKDKQLEEGAVVLEKCTSEIACYKNMADAYAKDIKSAKLTINAYKASNENLFAFMNERFEVVIAEITNTICEYAQSPDWKLTPPVKARYQNNVVSAITTAVQEILNYNKNKEE
jgi:hypothetical protein